MQLNYRSFQEKDLCLPNVLDGSSISEIEQFLKLGVARKFEKNEVLIHASSTETDVYYILKGQVKVSQLGQNGKELSFASLKAGESFGEFSAIDNKPRSACVISETQVYLLSFKKVDFLAMLNLLPKVNSRVLGALVNVIREMDSRIVNLATLSSRQRLYLEIQRIANEQGTIGGVVYLKKMPTGEDLASKVACAREVVSREISWLKQCGVIQKGNACFEIRMEKLSKMM